MYFTPRDLTGLDRAALLDYAGACRDQIDRNAARLQVLEAELKHVQSAYHRGFVTAYGGAALAAAGIATTALLTPFGAIALAGGVIALFGMGDQGAKVRQRHLLTTELKGIRESDDFCASELKRISERL